VQWKREGLKELSKALVAFVTWADEHGFVIVMTGGYAASLLGRPRHLDDIDFLIYIEEDRFQEFARKSYAGGFKPRVLDVAIAAASLRCFLLCHEETGVPIDCIIADPSIHIEYLECLEDLQRLRVRGVDVFVSSPEQLILAKSLVARPTDLVDLEWLVALQGNELDWNYIMHLARAFSNDLERSDFIELLERLERMSKLE